ncbi:MAG: hypothetical protein N5P05_000304 [Chroococcopsis gigantea SAG 12.99]|jgi:predicted nucleic acid-binding protein|nr:hypothetical protein [Chroococcopsis gigantea SAG 12.99]
MTKILCLDASFIIRYLTSQDTESIYQRYWSRWKVEGAALIAPTLIMYEVLNAFHRASIARQMTDDEVEEFLELALNLGLTLYGDAQLHREALKMAQEYNLPATYDAHYLALAQRLGVELWTADKRLYNTVCGSLEWVHLID